MKSNMNSEEVSSIVTLETKSYRSSPSRSPNIKKNFNAKSEKTKSNLASADKERGDKSQQSNQEEDNRQLLRIVRHLPTLNNSTPTKSSKNENISEKEVSNEKDEQSFYITQRVMTPNMD
jgi:hypothetical protein